MYSDKVAKSIQELLAGNSFTVYYVDQVPAYDQVKNLDGFVCWDIDELLPMHNTEGVEYADDQITFNFSLIITVYGNKLTTRNSIEIAVLDILQPKTSGKRIPLQQHQLTNGFIRYCVWVNDTEFPIPKTAQSNAEMSATVSMFKCSISIEE